jgi:LAGLIDADG DNA endonuclease family
MRKLTTEEFIERARKVHGDRYDYSISKYLSSSDKVSIRCIKHDRVFEQVANNHWLGYNGCVECSNGGIKLDTAEFIRRAMLAHRDKYDYSLVKYVDATTYVDIICPLHGRFNQGANAHLQGEGCRKCGTELTTSITRKSIETFTQEANEIHHGKYDYELALYKNSITALNVKCPIHGVFPITPTRHLGGYGCGECAYLQLIDERTAKTAHLKLSTVQYEHLIGSLLGDGHLSIGNKNSDGTLGLGQNSRLVIVRSIKDISYLRWERDQFIEFCPPKSKLLYSDSSEICKEFKAKSKVRFQTRSLSQFTVFRKEWYDNDGIKIIPSSLKLTPLTIAIWLADDGSISYKVNGSGRVSGLDMRFYTNGFSVDEVQFLIDLLQDRYNEKFNMNFITQENGNIQPIIRASTAGAIVLVRDIDFVFPKSMNRKSKKWKSFLPQASAKAR